LGFVFVTDIHRHLIFCINCYNNVCPPESLENVYIVFSM
jgi:hypothetical protein